MEYNNVKDSFCKFFVGNECVDYYLKDVRKYSVMSPAEEKMVFKEYEENGSKEAYDRIINSNQRFIYSLAKQYAKDENEVLDYVDEGNIGLIMALNDFKVEKGNKFITFAVYYIRRSMNYYLNVTNNLVKRSNSMKVGKKADRVRENYFNLHGEYPSDETVMELIKDVYGLEIKDISDVTEITIDSINSKIADDFLFENDSQFTSATSSLMEYEDDIEYEHTKHLVEGILDEIPDNLKEMVKMYFGIGYAMQPTMTDICKKMNMYPEDITVRINGVIDYLRDKYSRRKVG